MFRRDLAAVIGVVLTMSSLASVSFGDESMAQSKTDVWAGVYTKEQGERGHALYLARCAKCHTESLAGQPPAPALRGTGFMLNWNGKSVRDLQSRIRSTMPADQPGSLTRPESFEIAAFLLSANGFPAGTSELAGTPAQLSEILITDAPGRAN